MPEARKTILDNRYDVGRPLGSGGMGEVFLARDRVLGRDVALKMLRRQYASDREFAERFKREARSAASLSHPNIVQVYDRGDTEEGASYIAMEYVPGGTLKEKIVGEGPLGTREAAALGAQVAEALGAAHERGMVHRDIKPQNVLLTDKGDAKVADFGIARAGSSVTISKTGSVMGTAGYMSPEQALGKPATPKSDLYSLGVVLYEALTGELPFTADNPIAVSMKHVNEPLVPPGEIDPTIPAGMNALVTKLMAKDPEDRYASADELGDDLWKVSRRLPPTTAGEGRASHTQRTAVSPQALAGKAPPVRPAPVRRRRGIPWLPIVVAAMLLFLGTFAIIQKVMEPNSTNGWFDFLGGSENPPVRNSGPKMLKVPAVVGLTTAEARQNLTDAGLKVGLISRVSSDNVAAGRVIASGYSAGVPVKPGTAVNLDVSTGPATVSSPSPTASARSSPAPTATASPSSSSAQPSQQQQRQAAQQPADTNTAPKTKAKNSPAPSSPSPTARAEDKGAKQGISVTNGNSGPGGNSGNSGNSGPDSGKGNN
ncbi:MAG TPA: Stk1 family PASTA domain-containing Ser/Thr kinase [Rubrobacter sp.]